MKEQHKGSFFSDSLAVWSAVSIHHNYYHGQRTKLLLPSPQNLIQGEIWTKC